MYLYANIYQKFDETQKTNLIGNISNIYRRKKMLQSLEYKIMQCNCTNTKLSG